MATPQDPVAAGRLILDRIKRAHDMDYGERITREELKRYSNEGRNDLKFLLEDSSCEMFSVVRRNYKRLFGIIRTIMVTSDDVQELYRLRKTMFGWCSVGVFPANGERDLDALCIHHENDLYAAFYQDVFPHSSDHDAVLRMQARRFSFAVKVEGDKNVFHNVMLDRFFTANVYEISIA